MNVAECNNLCEKYCHKSIGTGNTFQQQYWYWYRQYVFAKVLLSGLTIVFTSIAYIPDHVILLRSTHTYTMCQPAAQSRSYIGLTAHTVA